jgi:hypothetical protein
MATMDLYHIFLTAENSTVGTPLSKRTRIVNTQKKVTRLKKNPWYPDSRSFHPILSILATVKVHDERIAPQQK